MSRNKLTTSDERFNFFLNNLLDSFHKAYPLKYVTNKKAVNKKWFNNECLKAHRKKQKLYKRYKNSGCPEDKLSYENQNRHFKRLIKRCKQSFTRNLLEDCEGNTKKTWKVINTLLGKSCSKQNLRLQINNEIVSDIGFIANFMNSYFNNVGETHGIKPQLHTYEYKRFLGRRMKDSFAFYDMTLNEMIQILSLIHI